MKRYALKIEYDGTSYHGWQKQKECKTVQGEIELAFSQFLNHPIKIVGSGRTDSGVNATGQVAHVDLKKEWDPVKLQGALNFFLRNRFISIIKISKVDENFHARFSAKSRVYEYKMLIRRAPLTFQKKQYWHLTRSQDIKNLKLSVQFLIGTHDFTTFRSSICQANSPIKTIDSIFIKEKELPNERIIVIEFKAKSFLHNQVRSIVGSLEKVSSNKWRPDQIKYILEAKDRSKCGPLAPPQGLYLKNIVYGYRIFEEN